MKPLIALAVSCAAGVFMSYFAFLCRAAVSATSFTVSAASSRRAALTSAARCCSALFPLCRIVSYHHHAPNSVGPRCACSPRVSGSRGSASRGPISRLSTSRANSMHTRCAPHPAPAPRCAQGVGNVSKILTICRSIPLICYTPLYPGHRQRLQDFDRPHQHLDLGPPRVALRHWLPLRVPRGRCGLPAGVVACLVPPTASRAAFRRRIRHPTRHAHSRSDPPPPAAAALHAPPRRRTTRHRCAPTRRTRQQRLWLARPLRRRKRRRCRGRLQPPSRPQLEPPYSGQTRPLSPKRVDRSSVSRVRARTGRRTHASWGSSWVRQRAAA